MRRDELLVHYWQLPEDIFISLKPEFHSKLCKSIKLKLKNNHKNCFNKILNCSKWHAQRLFTQFNRIAIKELEILREFSDISKYEVEKNINDIGCHESRTIIKNPKLPFQIKNLIYVASHLMFDGSYRNKKGCYFYAYEPSLVEYHKKRLSEFGEVPINFSKNENQLYFSHTIGYIVKKFLEIDNFRSTKAYFSEKMKNMVKENKNLTDEVVKALIIDEGNIEDKIEAELSNEQLVKDICESTNRYYKFSKITSRTRTIDFDNNPKWTYTRTSWNISFAAISFKELYKSISPLPIDYKNENLKFLFERQSKNFNQRKIGETKKLIVKSLIENPKTMEELAKELLVKQTTIRAHIKGHPIYKNSLINLGLIDKIDEKLLRRGGYAKVGVYGIKDIIKANEFLKN